MKIKLEKLSDVVKNPNHPIMQEVKHSFQSKAGDELECVKCGEKYIRGAWDFYQLCPKDFEEYDRKKWEARASFLFKK